MPFGEHHIVQAYEFADAAARTGAAGILPADVGRIARQLDDESFWILKDDSPLTWSRVDNGGVGLFLPHKAGTVLAVSFSGSPKKATVAFTTPFADTNYSVSVTPVTTNNKVFSPVVMSKAVGSFDIMLGSGSTTNLVGVGWVAMKDGESG